jgi:hypothetical protein
MGGGGGGNACTYVSVRRGSAYTEHQYIKVKDYNLNGTTVVFI